MNIRTKLVLMVGAILVLTLVLGVANLRALSQTNDAFATTYKDRVLPLDQLKVVADMYAVNIVDTTHKVNHRSVSWEEGMKRVDEADARRQKAWGDYSITFMVAEEKQLADNTKAAMDKADSAVRKLKDLLQRKDAAGLDAFARTDLYSAIDPVSDAVSKLAELQLKVAESNFEAAQREFADTTRSTIISLALVLLLGAGASWWIVTTIGNKIVGVKAILASARSGSDLTLRAPVRGQDEIDQIAIAYNAFAQSIEELLLTTAKVVQQVNSEAIQLAHTSQQIATVSEHGSEALASMAAAVEQVTASSAVVADSAKEARELGVLTGDQAQIGSRQIGDAVANINAINGTVGDAANKVVQLGDDAARITSVVSVIKEVADQTNLLALNAAIEAARAGEQGRGFAVVADEVRKLAERTALATIDIQKMIVEIGGTSQQAVQAIKQSVGGVSQCAELAQNAGKAMGQISAAAVAAQRAVSSIADALQEHKVSSNLIAGQVGRVAEMTEENAAAVASMSQSAAMLSALTKNLQTEVARFRFSAR